MKTLKSIILIAVIGITSYSAMAQQKVQTVPTSVSASFTNQYPQANLKSWEMDKNLDQYIASFTFEKRNWMAHYAADGSWLRSERNIKHMANVPADVRMALKGSKYASYHIDDIAWLEMPDHSHQYRLRIDNNNGNKVAYEGAADVDWRNLYYSSHGRLIRTSVNTKE